MRVGPWPIQGAIAWLPVFLAVVGGPALDLHGAVRQAEHVADITFGAVEPPVVAQQDVTVRAPMSNQQPEERALECSGMAWVDDRLLLVSDRHSHILFTCTVDLDRMTISQPVPHVVIRNEQDLLEDAECLTVSPTRTWSWGVYAMGSLSNDAAELPLPKRRHMLSFRLRTIEPFDFGQPVVLNAGTIRSAVGQILEAAHVRPYRTYYEEPPSTGRNTYRWGNVEGMCFTPDGSSLLLGMRNPLCDDSAILVVVQGVAEALRAGDSGLFRVTDVFGLDLGARGVSDLAWDPVTHGYLIAAAKSNGPRLNLDEPFPPNTLDSALFWWSGDKSEGPILFARMPDLKIEAICRLGTTAFIAVGSDEGDVSEGRVQQQQSILTILAFTGITRVLEGR
ncbi:MAG: hypothetical protein KBE04_10760 [Phycisphaerae bacterium]|nr:hypothetical protein [Phycisphaerae bacterium]